jgi:hypothetical protein
MKTLTTPIQNSKDVPRITKFEVVDVVENDAQTPPNLNIAIVTYGPNNSTYKGVISLVAYDDQASTCLQLNSLQQGYDDLFAVVGRVVTGAYTTLSTAYNANVTNATKRKRCLAVENLLASTLMSTEFAAT